MSFFITPSVPNRAFLRMVDASSLRAVVIITTGIIDGIADRMQ
ncbi:hypothetical protein SAMN06295888_12127 [Desulfonatronum zhilinae]|nr:hypothetical protein SAMN06295888_12127 [Desulfonatronum zhilinae]